MVSEPLMQMTDFNAGFRMTRSVVQAVNGVALVVARGEALGIVGESGCGKSTLALAMMGLLDKRHTTLAGSIRFRDEELVGMPEKRLCSLRGDRIAMIFQDPMTSLNPYLRIGLQLTEGMRLHLGLSKAEAARRGAELLKSVGVPDAEQRMNQYPHEFSGGMRQRVMIAMALACSPDLILADEPTTALDVTIQAQILELFREQLQQRGMSLILITHDLGVAAGLCERVAVMYAGRIVEQGQAAQIFEAPCHPYTHALLSAVPRVDRRQQRTLQSIPGQPPDMAKPVKGCAFQPRCPRAKEECRSIIPPLREDSRGRTHRCLFELDLMEAQP